MHSRPGAGSASHHRFTETFEEFWDGILLEAVCPKLEPITEGGEERDGEFGETAPIKVRTKPIQPSKKEIEVACLPDSRYA